MGALRTDASLPRFPVLLLARCPAGACGAVFSSSSGSLSLGRACASLLLDAARGSFPGLRRPGCGCPARARRVRDWRRLSPPLPSECGRDPISVASASCPAFFSPSVLQSRQRRVLALMRLRLGAALAGMGRSPMSAAVFVARFLALSPGACPFQAARRWQGFSLH